MLRLAVFLGVVLLLFQAGIREIAPDDTAPPAPRITAITQASRIAGPDRPAIERPVPLPPGVDPADPPRPFDLSLTTLADAAALPGGPVARNPGHRFKVTAAKLSLRTGPSILYPELAILSQGDLVTADGRSEGEWLWVRAQAAGLSGYVAAGLVTHLD